MRTVTLEVKSPDDAMADFVECCESSEPGEYLASIAFATPELLCQILTAKRWQLLTTLCGAGPVSIHEAARRVGRDVKAVHADVTALLNAGILDRSNSGGIVFPFDAIKVAFPLQAA